MYRDAGIKSGSSHSGRRTMASRLLEQGHSLEILQLMLGHAELDHVDLIRRYQNKYFAEHLKKYYDMTTLILCIASPVCRTVPPKRKPDERWAPLYILLDESMPGRAALVRLRNAITHPHFGVDPIDVYAIPVTELKEKIAMASEGTSSILSKL